jgi:hypothetical protein
MTDQGPQGPGAGAGPAEGGRPPTEEELRAAYEAELARIRVEDVLVQTIISLLNLGARRAGLAPGTESERDLEQVRQAVEATRALLPLVEPALGPDAAPVRDAMSRLQMAYAQAAQGGAEGAPPAAEGGDQAAPKPADGGSAPSSGRLWVPGQ